MQPDGIDTIKRYLQLVHKKRLLFAITAFLIISAVIVWSYSLPKVYKANATVFVERNIMKNLVRGITESPSLEERLKFISYAMKSRSLLRKVIDDLGVEVNREKPEEIEALISRLADKTNISIQRTRSRQMTTDVFTVSYIGKDPIFVRDYVNTLVKKYIEGNLAERRDEVNVAGKFLLEQVNYFKEKINRAEEEIRNYRKEKGIIAFVDDNDVLDEIKAVQHDLEEVRLAIKELAAKENMLKKQIGTNSLLILQKRLNELLIVHTENYPDVIRVKAEIELLKEQLRKGQIEDIGAPQTAQTSSQQHLALNDTRLELSTLKAKEKHLMKLIESKKEYLEDIPFEKKKLADMERERDADKSVHEQLLARYGKSEVSQQIEEQDMSDTFLIGEPALLPRKSESPNRVFIILFGVFAGFAGGFGLVLLLDYIDTSVKTVDVLKTLKLPVLAIIPRIYTKNELKSQRKKDITLFAFAGLFMLCVLGILAIELMNS
ncbi:MAG: Wzz/FepE/Etk N-terminal domain-containing protein [Candidatus Mariimomonas ferrooxydans]